MTQEKKQVRNTKQRQHLLALLQSTTSHPNAFWLFEKMKPAFPNLSLSTVYRNLGILEEQGMLQRLSPGSAYDRYDANTAIHSHFYCKECGQVYDHNTNGAELYALKCAKDSAHQMMGCNITYYGVCTACKQ